MNTIINSAGITLDTILKSKEIYHTAFDVSGSPQAIVSLDRRIMRANRAFSKATGYSELDLMSLNLQDILIPDTHTDDEIPGPDSEISRGCRIETDYISKNGDIRRGRFCFHLMKDHDTGPVCWVLILEDLTASRAADDAIRDYNQLFHHFISDNSDSIMFLDTKGTILYMNKAARKQLSVTSIEDTRNKTFADYWSGLEKAAIDMAVKLATNGMGGNFRGCINGPGQPLWWDVDITPIAGGTKIVERLMVISCDITAQRTAEQALADMKKEMEQKELDAERRLALEQERHAAEKQELAQAIEIAGASLHGHETLLREIHHRVKNNMQVISSLISLQSGRVSDPEIAGMFRNLRERICSMSKVHEKLSVSKDLARIDFREYIADLTSELLHSYAHGGQVRISADVDEIFLGIQEAVPCGLLITEIISNAMKYAFPDGRKGEIKIHFNKGIHGNYTLKISDNGIGLPDSVNSDNRSTLGMDLINELTKQIKGTVSVDSTEGTEYTILFHGAASSVMD